MTHHEYAIYAQVFDAVLAARGIDKSVSIQLHGDIAGAALRTWALGKRLDVVPEVREARSIGTWTRLSLVLPGDYTWTIIVHLDDCLKLDAPTPAAVEVEIPF